MLSHMFTDGDLHLPEEATHLKEEHPILDIPAGEILLWHVSQKYYKSRTRAVYQLDDDRLGECLGSCRVRHMGGADVDPNGHHKDFTLELRDPQSDSYRLFSVTLSKGVQGERPPVILNTSELKRLNVFKAPCGSTILGHSVFLALPSGIDGQRTSKSVSIIDDETETELWIQDESIVARELILPGARRVPRTVRSWTHATENECALYKQIAGLPCIAEPSDDLMKIVGAEVSLEGIDQHRNWRRWARFGVTQE